MIDDKVYGLSSVSLVAMLRGKCDSQHCFAVLRTMITEGDCANECTSGLQCYDREEQRGIHL